MATATQQEIPSTRLAMSKTYKEFIIETYGKNPAAVALGKLGGASKSTAKQRASKKNGRKGGRPKQQPKEG